MTSVPDIETMRDAQEADFWAKLACQEILDTYGERVVIRPKSLNKFGRTTNADTDVATTVMQMPGSEVNETYVTSNLIDTISSSDASDAVNMVVVGETVSGTGVNAKFTRVEQTATLDGQNKVTLATPLARVSRAYNDGDTDLAGSVYIYEDTAITAGVPNDATKSHLIVDPVYNQSTKAADTFSNNNYGILTDWHVGVSRNISANVDTLLEVRLPGKVFRTREQMIAGSTSKPYQQRLFRPYIIVPKNSDVRIRVIASANNTVVIAGFSALYGLTDEGVTAREGG